jgi:type II secretory ATPase GspE/PulE/Tfp pilus assembly ATPase PilB-like protein
VQNRRWSRRIRLQFPIWFCRQHHPEELLAGVAQNVSATGMIFLTRELVNVATSLRLFFDNMPGDRTARQLGGMVTRTEIDEETGQYLIGVQFTEVSESDRTHIAAALSGTDIMGLLQLAAKKGASDLHLSANHPPIVRVAGELSPLRKSPISGPDLRDMLYTLLDERHRQVFEQELELNFSLSVTALLRFRVNVHMQRGNVEAAFRQLAPAVWTVAQLHLPEVVQRLADFHHGLVLVTGPTGAGKTTTVAAMVEHINTTRGMSMARNNSRTWKI